MQTSQNSQQNEGRPSQQPPEITDVYAKSESSADTEPFRTMGLTFCLPFRNSIGNPQGRSCMVRTHKGPFSRDPSDPDFVEDSGICLLLPNDDGLRNYLVAQHLTKDAMLVHVFVLLRRSLVDPETHTDLLAVMQVLTLIAKGRAFAFCVEWCGEPDSRASEAGWTGFHQMNWESAVLAFKYAVEDRYHRQVEVMRKVNKRDAKVPGEGFIFGLPGSSP